MFSHWDNICKNDENHIHMSYVFKFATCIFITNHLAWFFHLVQYLTYKIYRRESARYNLGILGEREIPLAFRMSYLSKCTFECTFEGYLENMHEL
jgi:hypothetical protein